MTRQQLPSMEVELGKFAEPVKRRLSEWHDSEVLRRLRDHDPTLWVGNEADIATRLGWLRLPQDGWLGGLDAVMNGASEAARLGVEETILIGMGGSSLAPLVLERVFKPKQRRLRVVDSTHPDCVRELVDSLPPEGFQFVVSSKSGTTLETRVLTDVLSHAAERWVAQPGSRFLAITDPGTPLATLAERHEYRRVFAAPSSVGGRFSALSVFGLLPAALMGVNPEHLLRRAAAMEDNCLRGPVSVGLGLGAVLGECALAGRDKLTFLTSPGVAALPLWIEQLVAESLGKDGKGIVPVCGEPRGDVDGYADDRVFVGIAMEGEEGPLFEFLKALAERGHPTVRMALRDRYDLGAEFFRWEVAVSTAAIVLGVNPFDQPDVEGAKSEARKLLEGGRVEGAVPGVVSAGDRDRLAETVKTWLGWASPGDYFGILAYVPPSTENDLELAELQRRVRDATGIAATAAYGPRYLHSTGQLHKGGPNSGIFLQIVPSPRTDFLVPGEGTSLGGVIRAQADGDAAALQAGGRRVLRVDLETSGRQGLWMLRQLIGR